MSRAKPVEIRLPVLSSIHFTGRSSRIEARIETTYPGQTGPLFPNPPPRSGEMIRIICSGSSATSATAARMMCGACVVMYTVSFEVDRLKSAIDPQHSIGDGGERGECG